MLIRKAAVRWGVPRLTLIIRLKGSESHSKAYEFHQRLLPAQEKHLVLWVLVQDALGVTLTYRQLRDIAQRILSHSGDN